MSDEYTCRACVLGSWPTDDLTGECTYNRVSVASETPRFTVLNLGHTHPWPT